MNDVICRYAATSDLNQIYSFEKIYIEEIEPENLAKWLNAASVIKAQLASSLEKTFVAESDGQVVGHCSWGLHEGNPHVLSIFVDTFHRRQGIAAKLLARVESDIQNNGFKLCKLITRVNNPAQYLFRLRGYALLDQQEDWLHYEKHFS